MKKLIAVFLCLAMLLACAAVSAEETVQTKYTIGTISINGAFSLKCAIPEGYSVKPIVVDRDQTIAFVVSEDESKPVMTLSVAFDETYSDVDRMNDLDEEALAILEETFTDVDPTVELSYGETGLGTRLLIARQSGDDAVNYIAFLSIYKGYFVEFVLTPSSLNEEQKLTDDQLNMCIDFLTELDFVPLEDEAEDLAGKTFPVKINDYIAETGMLSLTIRQAITLDASAVEALQEGDTVTLGDETVEIYALSAEDGSIILNDEIELRRQENGAYRAYFYDSEYRIDLNTILVPVPENLVYIDDVDPETLGMLEESVKLTAADFLAALETDEIGFAADNVRVTFDENGDLAVIDRYYVPWQ